MKGRSFNSGKNHFKIFEAVLTLIQAQQCVPDR
jgi:hypothetical protein